MKGAEAYVNDQWNTCGLADLPRGPESHCVTLHFILPRDAQFTGLIEHIREVAHRHLTQAYPHRQITPQPVTGDVVGDGVRLVYRVGPLPH